MQRHNPFALVPEPKFPRVLVMDGMPTYPPPLLRQWRDLIERTTTLLVTVGDDSERLVLRDATIEAAGSILEDLLRPFFTGLPNRFRASWATPGRPWPDCLPPMFPTTEVS